MTSRRKGKPKKSRSTASKRQAKPQTGGWLSFGLSSFKEPAPVKRTPKTTPKAKGKSTKKAASSSGGWLGIKDAPAPDRQPSRKVSVRPTPKTSPKPVRKVPVKPARKPLAKLVKAPKTITTRQLASARKVEKRGKKIAEYKNALKGYRVRAKDKGKIIYITKAGKVTTRHNRKKVYAIYVPKTGRKKSIRAYREPQWRDKVPHALKPTSIKLTNMKAPKKALDAAVEEALKRTTGSGRVGITYQQSVKSNNWKTIVPVIAGAIKGVCEQSDSPNLTLWVEMRVAIRLPDGTVKTVPMDSWMGDFFNNRSKQAPSSKFFTAFVDQRLYAVMANRLGMMQMVTKGSAAFVKRMKENQGVDRDSWTKYGMDWGKADFTEVDILRIDFRINEQQVKSGDDNEPF